MFAKALTKAAAGLTNELTPHRSPLTTQRFGAGALEQAHMLQRSIGNQATLRLLTNQLAPTVERSQPGLAGAVTDGIDIEPSEQVPTDKNGDAGAPAPDAGAPAPDAGAPAAVTAVAFGTINSATTPAGMISRIPPRIDQPISVAITGAGNVDISVDGASGANGTATLDGAATKTLAASGTVNLRGATQTTAGNAGNLRLVAKVGGTAMGTSNAFTICAIPTTVTASLAGLITGTERGIKVTLSNDSDSGQVSDLDQVQMSEKVQYLNGAGCFAGITRGNNSGFLPANNAPHGVDSHGMPVSLITGAGSLDARQVFVFNDARSGANNVSVKNSGFNIHREVTATVTDAGTNLSITTSKAGMATTVAGSAAQSGSGSGTGTQAV
jgi:hypothetical protein